MANKHMKRCSTPLLTAEDANKIHKILLPYIQKEGYNQKQKTASIGKDTANGNVKWYSCHGKVWQLIKKLKYKIMI
jgi:hypothetical protein